MTLATNVPLREAVGDNRVVAWALDHSFAVEGVITEMRLDSHIVGELKVVVTVIDSPKIRTTLRQESAVHRVRLERTQQQDVVVELVSARSRSEVHVMNFKISLFDPISKLSRSSIV